MVSEDRDALQKVWKKDVKNVEHHVCDARDPDLVDSLLKDVTGRHGHVDGIVNCVGDVVSKSATATSLTELDAELRLHVHTSFNIVKSGAATMLNSPRGGSIVLTSAAVAHHGFPHFEAMSAAKAGIEGLARSAAASYAPRGVRINCVAPGKVKRLKAACEKSKVVP